MKTVLRGRLAAVASLVRDGAYLADIGTDHAYLPIYLMQTGRIKGAVASDIRSGPLARAQKNILAAGLAGQIHTVLTDGLSGLDRYPLTDIVIAGMGGMEIAAILEAAPFVKRACPRLILQPMQHIPELRDYLSGGWNTEKETQAIEGGKLYQILCVTYDGISRPITETERLLGRYNIEHKKESPALFRILCERHLAVLDEKIAGLEKGGLGAAKPKELRRDVAAQLEDLPPQT